MLAALAVVLSPLSFPVGPSKCFPAQHAVNAVAGVLLGPWWAVGAAFVASSIRYMMGTGTILAYPGSLFGALAVGLVARGLPKRLREWAALAEPCATGTVGALAASAIASPGAGMWGLFGVLSPAFLISSVPGCLLGFVALKALRRFLPTAQAESPAN